MPEEVPPRNIVVKLANDIKYILESPVVWFRGIFDLFFTYFDFFLYSHWHFMYKKQNHSMNCRLIRQIQYSNDFP